MGRKVEKKPLIDKVAQRPKTQYLKRDNIILRVASYLVTKKHEGATVHNIISARGVIGLSSQDQSRFTEKIMNVMENDGWVRKINYSKRFMVYFITEKGQSALSDALKLRHEGSLLATLEAFKNIVSS